MDPRFHAAQAAMTAGDVEGLKTLLAAEPELATARSQCSHPTLLQCLVLTMPPVDTLEDLIDLLANHGAELNDPLIAAASLENVRATKKLLDLGAQVNGNGRWSPLEECIYWGNAACIPLLLEHGAAVTNLRTAAGLGLMPYIARCFDDAGSLTEVAGEVASPWFNRPNPGGGPTRPATDPLKCPCLRGGMGACRSSRPAPRPWRPDQLHSCRL